MMYMCVCFQFASSEVIQEVQNGGSIIQEEDSCVIADLTSDKEEVVLVKFLLLIML